MTLLNTCFNSLFIVLTYQERKLFNPNCFDIFPGVYFIMFKILNVNNLWLKINNVKKKTWTSAYNNVGVVVVVVVVFKD